MARYKDVEGYRKLFDEEYKETRKLISEGETHLDNLAEGFSEASRVIDRIPTADVVPKSEYDAVVSAVDNSTQEFLKLHDDYQEAKREVERLQKERDEYKKHVDNDIIIIYVHRIKAEVAREIFEEIERLLSMHFCSCLPKGATEHYDYYEGDLADAIAELKKKYTKENTKNENQN